MIERNPNSDSLAIVLKQEIGKRERQLGYER